ncbi:MAG: hypothetical protein IKQ31_04440 [Clostridia bacterium]|nr:hypothetical protein [Clostridia bacterium]
MSLEEYQENKDGKYMFHGSIHKLDSLKPMKATDSNGTLANIDTAIFLSSDFLGAIPYAFKDTIRECSKGLPWSFSVSNSKDNPIRMKMKNVRVDPTIEGYVYVFEKTGDMVNDPAGSIQYKCYKNLTPKQVLKVKYEDYAKYFEIEK